ncbi:MAG: hypothetical protein HYW24_01505 [Candidatus Aenigmarchaeota archaeon]|nr:hypothetical protein [Candidatus Aenigmarchaeota archaeon]
MAIPIETFLSPQMVQYLVTLIIPFVLLFSVLFVGLRMTRIFGDNNPIYLILSLGFVIMIYAVQPDTFAFLAGYLFQIGVMNSILVLLGFIALVFWFLIRKSVSWAASLKGDEQKLEDLRKLESKLLLKLYNERNMEKKIQVESKLTEVQREMKILSLKLSSKLKRYA